MLSARLPPAREDPEWLDGVARQRDTNVRLTRLRFEDWMQEAFLAGYEHKRWMRSEASYQAYRLGRLASRRSIWAVLFGAAGLGLLAQAIGGDGLLFGAGGAFLSVAGVLLRKRY